MDTTALEALYRKVEEAIDAQGFYSRIPSIMGDPIFSISRHGVTVRIAVKAPRKRKPSEIWAEGETVEAAVEKFVHTLEFWKQVDEKR